MFPPYSVRSSKIPSLILFTNLVDNLSCVLSRSNHQLVDYDAVLDAKFGAKGTASRLEAEEKAYAFYTGQIIEDARKKAKISQAELARRIGSNRSYISRVESGQTEPKVSTFYRIMNALGCKIELSMSL